MTEWRTTDTEALRAALSDTGDMAPPRSPSELLQLGYETQGAAEQVQRDAAEARDLRLVRQVPDDAQVTSRYPSSTATREARQTGQEAG